MSYICQFKKMFIMFLLSVLLTGCQTISWTQLAGEHNELQQSYLSIGGLSVWGIKSGELKQVGCLLSKKYMKSLYSIHAFRGNSQSNMFYFGATLHIEGSSNWSSGIYKIDLNKRYRKPVLVRKTSKNNDDSPYGALSPNKQKILYCDSSDHGNKKILDLRTGKSRVWPHSMNIGAYWLSNKQLICSEDKRIFCLNLINSSRTYLNLNGYYLTSISPDKKTLILMNHDRNKVYLYNMKTMRLKKLFSSYFSSSYDVNTVWAPRGQGFFFFKADLLKTLSVFTEIYSVRYYSLRTGSVLFSLGDFTSFGGSGVTFFSRNIKLL